MDATSYSRSWYQTVYIMSNWWMAAFFLCSLLLTGLCRLYALKVKMLDIPNTRSSHTVPTPRGGGIGLVITFLAGSGLITEYSSIPITITTGVIISCALVAIVGFIDDHFHLPALFRLATHSISALIFLNVAEVPTLSSWFPVDFPLYGFNYLIFGISLVWLLNLYNFMDGIDGIAGTETLSVIGGVLFILWASGNFGNYGSWIGILGAAVAGFLVWNWPPAKIFMGDVGSGFLGFILGCFAILTSNDQTINIWTWVILLAVFIVDATVTLLRRFLRGEHFWMAHRSHAYQILARRYNSHTKITLGVLLINIIWLLPLALLTTRHPPYALFFILAATLPLIILAVSVGAGTTND